MSKNVQFEARIDRELAWYRGRSVRYVVARTEAPEMEDVTAARRVARNLAIVLDRSGSMRGTPLEMAKAAVLEAVSLLQGEDQFSLVVFDSEVRTLFEGVRVAEGLRQEVEAMLRRVDAGSQTNLSGGWLEGARQAAKVMEQSAHMQNHVLVLSDGQANQGEVSPAVLGRHAAELRLRGLTSSAIGIGEGYEQRQLRAIAEEGGGRLHDAQYPHEIVEVVAAEMAGFLTTAMEAVEMTIAVPDGVEVECLSGYPSSYEDGVLRVPLGMISSGKMRDVVYLVKLPGGERGEEIVLRCGLRWRAPGGDRLEERAERIAVRLTTGEENTAQVRDRKVAERTLEIWHSNLMMRAVEMNRAGDFEGAKAMLGGEIEKFRRYAVGLEDGDRLVAELERLLRAAGRGWNERGRKEMMLHSMAKRQSVEDGRKVKRGPVDTFLPE